MKRKTFEIYDTSKIYFTINFLLFICLIFLRIYVRYLNNLGTDEIEQVSNLISFNHLIKYLSTIPGGAPGHYLLTLPLNILFPYNKYILGLPGLISQIILFLFIPSIVKFLGVLNEKKVAFVSIVTRIGIVFSPTLTFQAMEVRPYSILPLLWALSVIIVYRLSSLPLVSWTDLSSSINKFKLIFPLLIVLLCHYYGLIMIVSLYLYFSFINKKFNLINFINLRKSSNIIILTSVILALPVWLYFSQGSFRYNFSIVEKLPFIFTSKGLTYTGVVKGIFWRNYYYLGFVAFFTYVLIKFFRTKVSSRHKFLLSAKIQIFLVLLPILSVFTLDYFNHYWFLLRQFSWVIIAFFISISTFAYDLIKDPTLLIKASKNE